MKIEITSVTIDEGKLKALTDKALSAVTEEIMADLKDRAVYTIYEGPAVPNFNPVSLESMSKSAAVSLGMLPVWEGSLLNSLGIKNTGDLGFEISPTVSYAVFLSTGGTAQPSPTLKRWYSEKKGKPMPDKPIEVQAHKYMEPTAALYAEGQHGEKIKGIFADMFTRG